MADTLRGVFLTNGLNWILAASLCALAGIMARVPKGAAAGSAADDAHDCYIPETAMTAMWIAICFGLLELRHAAALICLRCHFVIASTFILGGTKQKPRQSLPQPAATVLLFNDPIATNFHIRCHHRVNPGKPTS
jgi:hypothetical protein